MGKPIDTLRNAHQLHMRGDLSGAEVLYRKVLKVEPNNVHALNLLGALCVNSRRQSEAVRLIGRALRINADDPQALVNYALGLKDVGRVHEAREALQRSLSLDANNLAAMNVLGGILLETGMPADATAVYKRVLKIKPDFVEGWCNLSAALKDCKQYVAALESAKKAAQLDPKLPRPYFALAEAFRASGDLENAITNYKQSLSLGPANPRGMIALANAYRESDNAQAAIKLLKDLLELQPNNAEASEAMGLLQEQLGDLEAAARYLKATIALAPDHGKAHYQLAQLKGRQSTAEESKDIERLLSRHTVNGDDRRYSLFAAAIVFEQSGQTEAAFSAWEEANSIQAEKNPYNAPEKDRHYEALIRATTAAAPSSFADVDDSSPLFIIGMPRSGTTLTGQIMGEHSSVSSVAEVNYAYELATQVKALTQREYPEGIEFLSQLQRQQLAEAYRKRYPPGHDKSVYVLDNTPLNFQHIGLLALVFPKAKFIHCIRDPIDTCFSIFKLPFSAPQTYAHSLSALAHQYAAYKTLMRCWQELFTGRILNVAYEDTVADIERQSRRLVDFLDLPYEASMLNFYQSKQLIRTPSASQVRQPIYNTAVRAWKRYEPFLSPLIEDIGSS